MFTSGKFRVKRAYVALLSLVLLGCSLPASAPAAARTAPGSFGVITANCKFAKNVVPSFNELAGSFLGLGLALVVPISVALIGVLLLVAVIPKARNWVIEALGTTIGVALVVGTFGLALLYAIVGTKCG